jgi:hypothetical protein
MRPYNIKGYEVSINWIKEVRTVVVKHLVGYQVIALKEAKD